MVAGIKMIVETGSEEGKIGGSDVDFWDFLGMRWDAVVADLDLMLSLLHYFGVEENLKCNMLSIINIY